MRSSDIVQLKRLPRPWQMTWQRAPGRLLPREGIEPTWQGSVRGLHRGERLLDVFERQLELADPDAGFRGLAERLAPRLRSPLARHRLHR